MKTRVYVITIVVILLVIAAFFGRSIVSRMQQAPEGQGTTGNAKSEPLPETSFFNSTSSATASLGSQFAGSAASGSPENAPVPIEVTKLPVGSVSENAPRPASPPAAKAPSGVPRSVAQVPAALFSGPNAAALRQLASLKTQLEILRDETARDAVSIQVAQQELAVLKEQLVTLAQVPADTPDKQQTIAHILSSVAAKIAELSRQADAAAARRGELMAILLDLEQKIQMFKALKDSSSAAAPAVVVAIK